MQRYLIKFSYFGTHFRGLQAQGSRLRDFQTVQGLLESGLRFLRPANDPVTHSASRTDAGVHALCNALHVDLMRPVGQQPYDPDFITHHLNVFFRKAEVSIRVQNTRPVSRAFNCRAHACRRQYLYRLATVTDPRVLSADAEFGGNFLPLAEVDRLCVLRKPVDMELMREGCALLQREADFASFMHGLTKGEVPPDTMKNMEKVELREGQPLMNPLYDPAYKNLQFWDILFTSKSFLRNQIRRCVGAIVRLAEGAITKEDIEHMFAEPRPGNMAAGTGTAPGCGLYLLKIEYPDHVLDPNFVMEDVPEDHQQWADNAKAVKFAVALGQTTIVGSPPSPVEMLAKKFSESGTPGGIDASIRTVESMYVDEDSENSNLENECTLYSRSSNQNSVIDKKFTNLEGSTVPLSDARASSKDDAFETSCDSDGNRESTLENSLKLDTDDASCEDIDANSNINSSSALYSKGNIGSKKRRLLFEACDLLEARQILDSRLSILLEKLVAKNKEVNQCDYSEEGMERLAAEIKELMWKEKEKKIVLAAASKIRPVKDSRQTHASA